MAVFNTTGAINIVDGQNTIIGAKPASISVSSNIKNVVIQNATPYSIPISSYLSTGGKILSSINPNSTLYLTRGTNSQLAQTNSPAATTQANTPQTSSSPTVLPFVLTTGGSSGPSTYDGHTLNIPVYSGVAPAASTVMPTASSLGILTNGTDMTTALNTAFANANYSGIIMDFAAPGAVTINGTVNCGGKMILYRPGCKFTGPGILNNYVISAGYNQQITDVSVSMTNCSCASEMFSIKWYGAKGDNATDDQPALQKSSDTVIANTTMTRDLYCPPGAYKISRPWMLHNWNGTTYGQFIINVIGDWKIANSNHQGCARIIPTFKDGPAIGVQRATSGSILGLSIEGQFTAFGTFDQFVNQTFAAANTMSVRNSQYSPYAGIAIDPVNNGVSGLPPDGGYPPLNGTEPGGLNWYRGDGSRGGTTDFLISDCYIQGFTVDIMNTPNGTTQQGEDCIIQNCRLDYANVAVAYGQTQSDNCFIKNCRSWSYVWTVMDTSTYGHATGFSANIDGYNVAGTVNTLFNCLTNKAFSIRNFYAESFLAIGRLSSAFSGSILHGTFNFALSNFTPEYHAWLTNVIVQSSTIRYFDDQFNKRIRLYRPSNVIFEDCFFDLPPYIIDQAAQQYNTARFINCPLVGTNEVLGMNNDMYFVDSATVVPIPYGNFKIQNGIGSDTGLNNLLITYSYNCTTFNRFIPGFASGVTITPDANRQASFTVSSAMALLCLVNDIVIDDGTGKKVLGRITEISGTTITISEIPMNIVAGTFTVDLVYYISTASSCTGDVASGVSTITNVCPMVGTAMIVNKRFDSPMFPIGTYIVSYNSGTRVLTMSSNALKTAIRQNFVNGNPKVEVQATQPPTAFSSSSLADAFPTETNWTEIPSAVSSSVFRSVKWVFSKGGYLSATTLGLSASYQAEFAYEADTRISAGAYQWYDPYADTWTTLT